jgi:predicted enzyme related to lactoylglutathione lyase
MKRCGARARNKPAVAISSQGVPLLARRNDGNVTNDAASLDTVSPIFHVADLAQALDYYQKVLGFRIAWTWGDPPDRASVCRDRVEVTLAVPVEGSPRASAVYFGTTGVDDYYNQVSSAGGKITVPIADRPYGMRDFTLVDPTGNHLSFGEPTTR